MYDTKQPINLLTHMKYLFLWDFFYALILLSNYERESSGQKLFELATYGWDHVKLPFILYAQLSTGQYTSTIQALIVI